MLTAASSSGEPWKPVLLLINKPSMGTLPWTALRKSKLSCSTLLQTLLFVQDQSFYNVTILFSRWPYFYIGLLCEVCFSSEKSGLVLILLPLSALEQRGPPRFSHKIIFLSLCACDAAQQLIPGPLVDLRALCALVCHQVSAPRG